MGDHLREKRGQGKLVDFRITLETDLKYGPSSCAGGQAMVAGGLHGWTRTHWLNQNVARKHTRSGRRDRWPRRNIQKIYKHAATGLGNPKPIWNQIWWGMWRATKKASSFYRYITKPSPYCRMGEGTWWQRTWKKRRYWIPSSPWSLLKRFAFRFPRPLKPVWNSRAKKIYLWWRKIRSDNIKQTRQMQVHGPWSDALTHAEGAGQYHCEVTNIWKVMAIRQSRVLFSLWRDECTKVLMAVN